MAKRIIDISWPVQPAMTTYKDRNDVVFTPVATWQRDHHRLSAVSMNVHTGTHVDAPAHFLEQGCSVEAVLLTSLVGPCKVLDLTACIDRIAAADLAMHDLVAGDIVLCKTKNSVLPDTAPFDYNFTFLAADAAQLLVDKRIKAFGIDYIGIERAQAAHDTHKLLMSNNIAIVEGLRLGHVAPGAYEFICLPLLLLGLDGAPARAILLQD